MGILQQSPPKRWQNLDVQFEHILLKVEARVPDSDPLLIDYSERRRLKCKHILSVKAGGTRTVIIHAENCTPYEAAEEYRKIVNSKNGYNDNDRTDDQI